MKRDARPWLFLITLFVIALDRWSKLWVKHHIHSGDAITVIPHVFRITHVLNFGAAFSMFAGPNHEILVRNALIAFSAIVAVVLIVFLARIGRSFTLTSFSLALILGGALGNLYDRAVYHSVIDFLEVTIVHYHWPDFNIADSAIVVGACLLLLELLKPQHD